ncbi:MAG: hypothetical protein AB8F74_13465 [Saprospiraceae bacterium]
MSSVNPINTDNFKQKSFWSRPEGVTGAIFLAAIIAGGGFLVVTALPAILAAMSNILYLSGMLLVLAVIVYMVLDPKMRNLVGYMYKSVMRWVTGLFVNIDPIGILKSYVEDLQDNLRKMSKQIGSLRGQMRKLQNIMAENSKEIDNNMKLASMARKKNNQQQLMLSTRKAARLKETNAKYQALTQKMDVMHKILSKMYQNSEILLEDTKDQVQLKEQERKAIRASHSAMTSAMSVISGDPDKRAMFDSAMEVIADDVANKVGEMERFMDMSANFMNSVDLQNGVFEEEGLKMLEKFEKESDLMLMGDDAGLDLNAPRATPEKLRNTDSSDNSYENLFD